MSSVQVPPDSTGKRIDTVTLTDATVEVHRQKMVITGGSGTAEVVVVTNAAPTGTDMGLVVRQAGSVNAVCTGTFNLSGTAVVAGVVALTAGTAVIGDLNAISRTVQVAIGTPFTLQGISTTVNVAVATPFTINNISATSIVAGVVGLTAGTANIGSINNISATVTVAGVVGLTAGTANIGSINNISATVTTAIRSIYTNTAVPSASRGPRCVIASTSANVSLIAAPGAGFAIYVTGVAVSNASGTNTRARVGTSASIGQVQMMMAASGGGFVKQFTPPWELSANEALLGSVKPDASEGLFNIHFFVASADAL